MDEKLNILADELDDDELDCVAGGAEIPDDKIGDITTDHSAPTGA